MPPSSGARKQRRHQSNGGAHRQTKAEGKATPQVGTPDRHAVAVA